MAGLTAATRVATPAATLSAKHAKIPEDVSPAERSGFVVSEGMASSGRPPWHRWYKTARWARLRQVIFRRDLFTCRGCNRLEGNTSRLACDHVTAHRGNERLFWDEANLQTLCKDCHDRLKQQEEQATRHQRGVWD